MRYVVMDTETTGMEDTDSLVEIAAVWDDGTWGHSLVRPNCPISFGAMSTHHITERMVEDAPGVHEALGECGFVVEDEADTVLVFHNAGFDRKFLPPPLQELRYVCTWRCALHLLPNAESHRNGALWYELGLSHPMPMEAGRMPHRALFDALMTADIMRHMLGMVRDQSIAEDPLVHLVWLSQQPVLLTKFSFGKHSGEPIPDIPTSYLHWITGQDFDEDVIHTARTHLQKRGALR